MGHRAGRCDSQPAVDDVNCVAREQKEDDDFRRAVELQISSESGNLNIKVNAVIDSGSPICFLKES